MVDRNPEFRCSPPLARVIRTRRAPVVVERTFTASRLLCLAAAFAAGVAVGPTKLGVAVAVLGVLVVVFSRLRSRSAS